ncbi:MAG: hypothetical protein IPO81_25520 [Kouleothrix sp.]|nr:hypothetical protein [Kouleothrix sp.]
MLTAAWLLVLTVNFSRCASGAALSNYAGLTLWRVSRHQCARAGTTGPHWQRALAHGCLSGNLECCAPQSTDQDVL